MTATLWLPRARETSTCLRGRPNYQNVKTTNLRVLLVDDDILVSMDAADMLLDLGHRVTEAHSGNYALELLESDSPFDVVMTDFAMPGMNGFELARRIQGDLQSCPSSWRLDMPNCRPINLFNSSACP